MTLQSRLNTTTFETRKILSNQDRHTKRLKRWPIWLNWSTNFFSYSIFSRFFPLRLLSLPKLEDIAGWQEILLKRRVHCRNKRVFWVVEGQKKGIELLETCWNKCNETVCFARRNIDNHRQYLDVIVEYIWQWSMWQPFSIFRRSTWRYWKSDIIWWYLRYYTWVSNSILHYKGRNRAIAWVWSLLCPSETRTAITRNAFAVFCFE